MLRSAILLGLCCALVGCLTPARGYEVTLKDGRRIAVKDWPHLNDLTGYYRCERSDGSFVEVHEAQVTSIREKDSGRS